MINAVATPQNIGTFCAPKSALGYDAGHLKKVMNQNNICATPWIESGNHFLKEKKWAEAAQCLLHAIKLDPDNAAAHSLIAEAYSGQRLIEPAQASYRRAHDLSPESPDHLYNLALFYQKSRLFEQAEKYYLKLLSQKPDHADGLANLGRLYQDTNQPEAARYYYEKDIELRPDDPDSHFNLAFIHLLTGNYEAGWREYEWRFKRPAAERTYPHNFEQPRWQGEPFPEKTLLIHGEQGYGDNFQFIRYVQLAKELGGRVLLEIQSPLGPLFEQFSGIDQLLIYNPKQPPAAFFDFYIPLLSLPRLFNTTPDSIPAPKPRLRAPDQLNEKWSFLRTSPRRQIGLVWGGNELPDPLRSCPAQKFLPLCESAGFDFYGLQTGPAAEEAAGLQKAPNFQQNLGPELNNFADTAAIIAQLDLVITIDTAVAHLAGAMGCPVWVLLPFAPDWRWFLKRKDSPWYPSMRLFRQTEPGNWEQPIDGIRLSLLKISPQASDIESFA